MNSFEYSSRMASLDRTYNNQMIRADRIEDPAKRGLAYNEAERAYFAGLAKLNEQRGI